MFRLPEAKRRPTNERLDNISGVQHLGAMFSGFFSFAGAEDDMKGST